MPLFLVFVPLALPVAAQEPPARAVANTNAGVYEVACGTESLVRLAEKGEPYLKLSCCLHHGEGEKAVWVEPQKVQSFFDFKKGLATMVYAVARLDAAYELKGQRLECSVSLRNTSETAMEFNVRLLGLKTLLDYWNCQGESFGTAWGYSASGCKIGVFVHNDLSGEYRKILADKDGFAPLSVKNRGPRVARHPVVQSGLLSDPGTLIAPGARLEFKVSLTFGAEDADDMELFARDFAESGARNPMALKWPDRRPIGTAFIARPNTGWTHNPSGYIIGFGEREDVHTEAGLAVFGSNLMVYADHCLAQLRDKNAQGVVFWDLEGQERPHAISYVGDPRKLAEVAPEMDRFADVFLKKFHDAGFRTGLTIRPTEYYDAAPGKRAWNQRDVRDPVALMSEKIRYARDRWGMTIFYLDSNVFSGGENVPWTMPTAMIRKLQEEHPDCLVIPEWSASDYYRWSAPYSSPNIGQLTTNIRDKFARVKWANAFGVVAVESSLLETQFGQYVDGVAGGDVLLFRCWFGDPVADLVKLVCHEADMNRRLAANPRGNLAQWLSDAASPDEIARYAAAKGLARFQEPRALAVTAGLLGDASLSVRRVTLAAIKQQGKAASPDVIDKLVAMLKADEPDARLLRQSATEALGALGDAAVPAMLAVLADPHAGGLRLYAARCIADSGTRDPAAAKSFLELFAKPEVARDRDLLEAVLHGLGRMQVREALPELLAMLAKDQGREREWARVGAIEALGDLGDPRAIGPLLEEYKHGYSNVEVYVFRRYLYEALTKLTGQKHAVWPDYEGWKKWLVEQKDGNHSQAERK
jgi:HEAT repeat protein